MNDSIDSTEKLTDSLIALVESTKGEFITANIKLWDVINFPELASAAAAGEATFWRFFLTAEKGRLLYTPWLSLLTAGKKEKGLAAL
jgi:hypothetical protein